MAQTTAKSVEDFLKWIEETPHHKGAWRNKSDRDYADIDDPEAFFVLSGHRDKLRVPVAIQVEARPFFGPSPGRFDTRMYRANKAGRARLRRALQNAQLSEAVAKPSPLGSSGTKKETP